MSFWISDIPLSRLPFYMYNKNNWNTLQPLSRVWSWKGRTNNGQSKLVRGCPGATYSELYWPVSKWPIYHVGSLLRFHGSRTPFFPSPFYYFCGMPFILWSSSVWEKFVRRDDVKGEFNVVFESCLSNWRLICISLMMSKLFKYNNWQWIIYLIS